LSKRQLSYKKEEQNDRYHGGFARECRCGCCDWRGHGRDYGNVLIPAVKEKAKKYGKIHMLHQFSRDFTSFTLDAIWEDAKISWHTITLERVAVVSDVHRINEEFNIFHFSIPIPVKLYSNDEPDKAKSYLNEDIWNQVYL
jgi:hypothetical protein